MNRFFCILCPKDYPTWEALKDHTENAHGLILPSNSMILQSMYSEEMADMEKSGKPYGLKCFWCPAMYSDLVLYRDHIRSHGYDVEGQLLTLLQETVKKIEKTGEENEFCTLCNQEFEALIATLINGKPHHVCFNCYEKQYGKERLDAIIGDTPPELLHKGRVPVK